MLIFSKKYNNWSLERIIRHIAYWTFWWLFYTVVNAGIFDEGSYSPWFLFELHILPLKLSITYFTIYYLFPKYAKDNKYPIFFLWILGLVILGGFVFRLIEVYFVSEYVISSEVYLKKIDKSKFLSLNIVYKALDLLFVVSLVLIIKFIQRQIEQERKTKSLITQKLETELNYLKHQLQPHFLFNTLNNLYGLIITKDENAGELVLKLSEILSYMLYDSNDKEIPLEKELACLSNYIELEKLRYGNELTITYKVDGSPKNHKIAPLILISFVENAFKHGPSDELMTSWINISADIKENSFRFVVENSIDEEHIKKNKQESRVVSGIGLSNVEKRLKLIYGEAFTLKISQEDFYKVELTINKHELSHSR
ncbi:sensor histidine kinase [Allomuricauda sp. SCSIO 65647]|uniref:sensor histidine kinase n=1 Tax=Allomuricauda sp. SCSIO 65647 TaxID=2908843 RepID=UPI001F16F63B|nr:histidine kinase [Muricauda sp. SCSIO 65647]UJH67804.1 histidine kinase [Muricauda sp. SCSIO 65647]